MTISFVDASDGSPTADLVGLQSGDALFAVISAHSVVGGVQTFPGPSSPRWVLIGGTGQSGIGTGHNAYVWCRRWSTGDPVSYQFQVCGPNRRGLSDASAAVVAYRGVNAHRFIFSEESAGNSFPSTLTLPATSDTSGGAEALIVYMEVGSGVFTWNDPEITERIASIDFHVADEVYTPSPDWPSRSITFPSGGNNCAVMRLVPVHHGMT